MPTDLVYTPSKHNGVAFLPCFADLETCGNVTQAVWCEQEKHTGEEQRRSSSSTCGCTRQRGEEEDKAPYEQSLLGTGVMSAKVLAPLPSDPT